MTQEEKLLQALFETAEIKQISNGEKYDNCETIDHYIRSANPYISAMAVVVKGSCRKPPEPDLIIYRQLLNTLQVEEDN